MCKISVIVPVYMVEQYLKRCVDSILNQIFTDFELILIDDGSTDRSAVICDEYAAKDNRVKVIHNKNAGVSHSRNCGIDNATGEYIVFVDSDDYIEPEHLEQFADSNADLMFTGYTRENASKNYQNRVELCPGRVSDIRELYNRTDGKVFGYMWAICVRKEFINKHNIRLNENYSFREDILFTIECFERAETAYIGGEATYHYVLYGDSRQLSNKTYEKDIFNEQIKITERLNDLLLSIDVESERREKVIFHHCYRNSVRKSLINAMNTGNLTVSYIESILNNDFVKDCKKTFNTDWINDFDKEWKKEIKLYLEGTPKKIYRWYMSIKRVNTIKRFLQTIKSILKSKHIFE